MAIKLKNPNSEKLDNLVNSWTLAFKNDEYELDCNDHNPRLIKVSKLNGEKLEFHFALLEKEYVDDAALDAAVLDIWNNKATLVYNCYPVVLHHLKAKLHLD